MSEASSAAQAIGTGAKAPGGPRPGANGFGSFCRNKRARPERSEAKSKGPRRAGAKPRENLSPSVIPDILNRGSSVFSVRFRISPSPISCIKREIGRGPVLSPELVEGSKGWGEGKTDERHWIHLYAGSPIKDVGDKPAGMTEGDKRLLL